MEPPLISVILVTYESDLVKTFKTINSILLQNEISFELIIADDGSKDNHFKDIKAFLEKKGFSRYRLLEHEKNQGTVHNIIDALETSQAPYVKTIAPGDYFYACDSLVKLVRLMQENEAAVVCGRAIYYAAGTDYEIVKNLAPVIEEPFLARGDDYKQAEVSKSQIVYCDNINAATSAAWREEFLECLKALAGTVLYCEDFAFKMMIVQGYKMMMVNDYIAWYETGIGISTASDLGALTKMDADYYAFWDLMQSMYPDNKDVRRKHKQAQFERTHPRKRTQQLYRCSHPDYLRYRIELGKIKRRYYPTGATRKMLEDIELY